MAVGGDEAQTTTQTGSKERDRGSQKRHWRAWAPGDRLAGRVRRIKYKSRRRENVVGGGISIS